MVNNELNVKNIKDKSKLLHTSPENILREELQKCVLYLLSETDFFAEGVFQGGTALRIVYENIRYSEDLDFVFMSKNSPTFKSLEIHVDKIPQKLKKWFPYLTIQQGKWQKQSELLKRFQFTSTNESIHAKLMLQLEFANIPSYQASIRPVQWNMFAFPLRVESETEILIDKLIAFGLRKYLKGRDLWDLYYLFHLKKIELNPSEMLALLGNKIEDYGFNPDQYYSRYSENLILMREEGLAILNNEMKRFMSLSIYTAYAQEFSPVLHLLLERLSAIKELFHNEH